MILIPLLSSTLISVSVSFAAPVTETGSLTTTEAIAATFPTNIGFLGKTGTGAPPFLAQTDNVAQKTGTPTQSYTLPQPYESSEAYDHQPGDESIYHMFGSISPYYVSDGWGVYDYALPDQCRIKTVQLTSRHGTRYPTSKTNDFWKKIKKSDFTASGNLSFLNNWEYAMGTSILTSLGNQQLFDKGVRSFFRYGALYDFENKPKIVARTTTEERMTMTALYYLNGFFGLNWQDYADLELIIEEDGYNSTLSPNICLNADSTKEFASDKMDELKVEYLTPALDRFNALLSGLELDTSDLYDMQELCAYETNNLGYSKFCSLFSQKEWEWYGYLQDIKFYYKTSFGNPTARARGIGQVTELQQRLSNSTYNTSVQSTQNSTLDSDPSYFPLNQSLYFDFTHDTYMTAMLTALGFEQFKSPFDFSGPSTDNSTFKSSKIVPFAAQFFFEVIECDEEVPTDRSALAVNGTDTTTYLHMLINDHTISLSENVPDYCEKRVDGWCKLDEFLQYMDTLFDEAEFDYSCFAEYDFDAAVSNGVPES